MKRFFGLVAVAVFLMGARSAAAATICPVTANTNTDCGYILTIGPGGTVTGAAVTGANPYDGADDTLVGVVNNSGGVYTGAITLTSSTTDIFGFDGDGICTFIGGTAAGSYCSQAATYGQDPADYEGPLNTFSNISANDFSGDVDITGLADGTTTFFSLEEAPSAIGPITVTTNATPEPSSLVLLSSGLVGVAGVVRRKFAA